MLLLLFALTLASNMGGAEAFKANPVEEVNHLRYWIWIIKWGLITYVAISMILIAWFGVIARRNKQLETRIKKGQD